MSHFCASSFSTVSGNNARLNNTDIHRHTQTYAPTRTYIQTRAPTQSHAYDSQNVHFCAWSDALKSFKNTATFHLILNITNSVAAIHLNDVDWPSRGTIT